MAQTYEKVTFTPLSRGRLRCNQTGVIVTSAKTKAYRTTLLCGGRKSMKTYTHSGSVSPGSTISCPVCHQRIGVGDYSGVVTCDNNHRINVTVRQKLYWWQ